MIIARTGVILTKNSDCGDLQKKGNQHHPENRARDGGRRRSFHHGRVYQFSGDLFSGDRARKGWIRIARTSPEMLALYG
jgi:hypothetical protein